MPMIQISDANFANLKSMAEPLVDTVDSVIERLIDNYRAPITSQDSEAAPKSGYEPLRFTPATLPKLTHVKLLDATLASDRPERMNWDGLVYLSICKAFEKYPSFLDVQRITGINMVSGKKVDEGYKHVGRFGLSYQGISAQDAARCAIRTAGALATKVSFEFEWRNKAGAEFPGRRGLLSA